MIVRAYFLYIPLLAAALSSPLQGQQSTQASLAFQEQWSCVFGGQDVVFHVLITSSSEIKGRMRWRLSSNSKTLVRNESDVVARSGLLGIAELRMQAPEIKEGVAIEVILNVSLFEQAQDKTVSEISRRIWILSKDPFVDRQKWLKDLNITLFDPEKKTAIMFAEVGIPFTEQANLDSLVTIKDGILVIGEGVSFKDYHGLPEIMVKVAMTTPVLCLAPADGEMAIPGLGSEDIPQPVSISFRQSDIITTIDKRLDSLVWPSGKKIAVSRLVPTGERGPVVCSFVRGSDVGWPWMEARFGNGKGKLIVCGFGLIESWDMGPTPRFLFAGILEQIVK